MCLIPEKAKEKREIGCGKAIKAYVLDIDITFEKLSDSELE